MPVRSRILATGASVPRRVVTNAELAAAGGPSADDMLSLTGIRERRWVADDQATSDLAAEAGRDALAAAGWQASALDAIIVSTTSPDTQFPSTACYVQHRLGARSLAAFDVTASCSGFLYGLSMADAFIRSGQYRTCLVIAAEAKSRAIDPDDPATRMLFGDGAGAALVIRDDASGEKGPGLLGVRLYADGSRHDLIHVPAGGSRLPTTADTVAARKHTLRLDGAPVFRLAVQRLTAAVQDLLAAQQLAVADVQHSLFHQANRRILAMLCDKLGIAPDRTTTTIEQFGNTSSASLPMALHEAARAGRLHMGDLVLLGAFGGGLTWGTALVRW
ncbi:MAG: beta-ketoacyl-ACP synthase III [Nitrospiraceae bacterium]